MPHENTFVRMQHLPKKNLKQHREILDSVKICNPIQIH